MAKDNTESRDTPVIESGEFRFKIDAFTPATIPMVRLGEYMTALAQLLGEADAVHFSKLTPGSTCVNLRVEEPAVPKVWARAEAVRVGTASNDVMQHYRSINRMLREDRGAARFSRNRIRTKVLTFPGVSETPEKTFSIKQQGSFQGQLMRLGGTDATVHLLLVSEEDRQSEFVTDRATAKRLARHMFESVRVFGRGTWQRDENGLWSLTKFKVDTFEVLEETKLSKAVTDLRTLADQWAEHSVAAILKERHGSDSVSNGAG